MTFSVKPAYCGVILGTMRFLLIRFSNLIKKRFLFNELHIMWGANNKNINGGFQL